MINATEVTALASIGLAAHPVLDILAAAGLLTEDRQPTLVSWFTRQTRGLPDPMIEELRVWFDVMRHGSTTPPRSRPRSPTTIRIRASWVLPTLRRWAREGHQSLREISRDEVLAALPSAGSPRATLGQGLRSLFTILNRRKLVFCNPLARVSTGAPETRQPLPLPDLDRVRAALNSPEPAQAAMTALLAFYGLPPSVLRDLQLTDLRDGHLHLADRVIPLADAVRQQLTQWLDHRGTRWPTTQNPHLFINRTTALRLDKVSHGYISRTIGITPRKIREDRILHEALASRGDPRRLCDLFGLSIKAAQRYTAILEHPDLTEPPDQRQ